MGVKSTISLTRAEAEGKYVWLKQDEMERKLRSEAVLLRDKDLENVLEALNDEANGGEGFENYIISNG